MRIYYIDESEDPRYYVRSALGVDAERWNSLHGCVQDWRYAVAGDYSVPTSRELHACDLLAGRGKLVRQGNTGRTAPKSSWTASRSSTSACARPR